MAADQGILLMERASIYPSEVIPQMDFYYLNVGKVN